MITTMGVSDAIARAKAPLRRDFPDWNFVHSSADRWWAFPDPGRRPEDVGSFRSAGLDADTAEALDELLAEAAS